MRGMIDAREYAKALFLLSEEEGSTDTVLEDVRLVSEIFSKNADYVKLLDTPALTKAEKLSLIEDAFSSLHYCVKNLLKILCEKHLVHMFKDVVLSFNGLYDEHCGIERAEAVTAIPLTNKQKDALSAKLSEMTGKKIILKNTVNPKILGGVMLRYSGIQLDGSVKTRLDNFAESLKNLNL